MMYFVYCVECLVQHVMCVVYRVLRIVRCNLRVVSDGEYRVYNVLCVVC